MPDDPYGLDWSQLQAVVAGLWEYIVTGMRYHTVTFDILDTDDDVQIGWGHIVKLGRDVVSKRTAKRAVQLSSPVLASSADIFSGQRNSSLPTPVGSSINWKVEDSDMTITFTPINRERGVRDLLDPEAVKNLFRGVIEIIQEAITTHGEQSYLDSDTFRFTDQIMLEIICWPHQITWEQFATAVLGLIDYIVDHNHFRTWYFSIYVQDPRVEIAIGKIINALASNNNNVSVARRH